MPPPSYSRLCSGDAMSEETSKGKESAMKRVKNAFTVFSKQKRLMHATIVTAKTLLWFTIKASDALAPLKNVAASLQLIIDYIEVCRYTGPFGTGFHKFANR